MVPYLYNGTQTPSDGDTSLTTTSGSFGLNSVFNIIVSDTSCYVDLPVIDIQEPKQPCYIERGHNWWYYNVFLPIPEKDIRKDKVPCGDRSPPIKKLKYRLTSGRRRSNTTT